MASPWPTDSDGYAADGSVRVPYAHRLCCRRRQGAAYTGRRLCLCRRHVQGAACTNGRDDIEAPSGMSRGRQAARGQQAGGVWGGFSAYTLLALGPNRDHDGVYIVFASETKKCDTFIL